jgi:hypothetical protein
MRVKWSIVAFSLTFAPAVAGAQPISWQRFVATEAMASVDIPTTVFTEDGGKPETGYGRRFLTFDRRANLTVQSVPNEAGDSPAIFLAKKNPPADIVYKRVTPGFFVVSSFRNDMICRPVHELRADKLPRS